MNQETCTLLLGLGIGFLTSLISLLITSKIQSNRDNRIREWEIKDEKNRAGKDIDTNRMIEFESYLQVFVERYIHAFYMFIAVSDKEEAKIRMHKAQIDEFPLLGKREFLFYNLYYINDNEITDLFEKILNKQEELTSLYNEFINKIERGEEVDNSSYSERLDALNFKKEYAKLIKRLDYLKAHWPDK